jgi:hypothetical protein
LLDRAHIQTRQTPDRFREVAIRPRIILRPERHSKVPITTAAAIAVIWAGRIHQPGEGPFSWTLPVLRQIEFLVFDTGILFERPLDGIQHPEKQEATTEPQKYRPPVH